MKFGLFGASMAMFWGLGAGFVICAATRFLFRHGHALS